MSHTSTVIQRATVRILMRTKNSTPPATLDEVDPDGAEYFRQRFDFPLKEFHSPMLMCMFFTTGSRFPDTGAYDRGIREFDIIEIFISAPARTLTRFILVPRQLIPAFVGAGGKMPYTITAGFCPYGLVQLS